MENDSQKDWNHLDMDRRGFIRPKSHILQVPHIMYYSEYGPFKIWRMYDHSFVSAPALI